MEFDFAGQFEYHPLDKDKKSAKSSILEHEPLTSATKLMPESVRVSIPSQSTHIQKERDNESIRPLPRGSKRICPGLITTGTTSSSASPLGPGCWYPSDNLLLSFPCETGSGCWCSSERIWPSLSADWRMTLEFNCFWCSWRVEYKKRKTYYQCRPYNKYHFWRGRLVNCYTIKFVSSLSLSPLFGVRM